MKAKREACETDLLLSRSGLGGEPRRGC